MKDPFKLRLLAVVLRRVWPFRWKARHDPSGSGAPQHNSKASPMKRRLLAAAGVMLLLGAGGFLLAASGIVPIRASSGHWAVTRWFLQFSKSRSVSTHTLRMKAPALDDQALVLKGAGHYEVGCAPCHGSPHRKQPRVAEHMLPPPPNLKFATSKWSAEELFYIVKHGIKLTGMPAWPARHRDDEIWAMVAFLNALPEMSAGEYHRLASGETLLPEGAPMEDLQTPRNLPRSMSESCARCHGADGLGRGMGVFPKLAGQKADYLLGSLEAYGRGERHSGIMEPIAAGLDSATMLELARYYAQLPLSGDAPESAPDAGAMERGKAIALSGVPKQGIPACVECHSHEPMPRNPAYPLLGGQYADYLLLQLELFQKGQRGGTPYSHLMHLVAGRLTPAQMRDVALYWSSMTHHQHGAESSRHP